MNRLTEHFFQTSTEVFTQPEMAVALGGTRFSRHGLVKRALADGEILGIRRGLYCLAPKYQKKPPSVYALSQRVYGPSYVSFESALSYHGWIPEAVYICTCASFGNAKEFQTPLGVFSYRRVPQRTFYMGVSRLMDPAGNVFLMASPAKALAEYVYARKPDWLDIDSASASLRIEPEDMAAVGPEELGLLMENYSNRRVQRFLDSWRKALSK